MAWVQTCPRNRGGIPFHHIFRCEARSSELFISVAQLGRTRVDQYSAFMREAFSRARASSWARWASSRSVAEVSFGFVEGLCEETYQLPQCEPAFSGTL